MHFRAQICKQLGKRGLKNADYWFNSINLRSISTLPFASVEVEKISGSQPAEVQNLGSKYDLSTIKDELQGKAYRMLLRTTFDSQNENKKEMVIAAYYEDNIHTTQGYAEQKLSIADGTEKKKSTVQ